MGTAPTLAFLSVIAGILLALDVLIIYIYLEERRDNKKEIKDGFS